MRRKLVLKSDYWARTFNTFEETGNCEHSFKEFNEATEKTAWNLHIEVANENERSPLQIGFLSVWAQYQPRSFVNRIGDV